MDNPGHYVAIFGGAVSGAEAAAQLSQRGIRVVVFDQSILPYGKIEDGLPKWHAKLRDKEEAKIDEKLSHELVEFVPNTKLGTDISFEDVVNNWGFSAIVLATGAWDDRPLGIEGIDDYVDRGLYYQNRLSIWFNHYHESNYSGKQYEIVDDAIVIGGGLASIDMAKMIMMELVKEKLTERGIESNILVLDKGIDRVLEANNLTFEELGLKGCTLYYRRRDMDMPLSPMPINSPEDLEKAQNVRVKVLNNAMRKFFFKFQGNRAPVDKIVDGDRLIGIKFQETKIEDNKVVAIEGSFEEIKTPLVVSSIGSLPEQIEGVPKDGSTYKIVDWDHCQIEGFENVFAVGNAVTGRGNIKESYIHGNEISKKMMDSYLGWTEENFEKILREKEAGAKETIAGLIESFNSKNLRSVEELETVHKKVQEAQSKVGYGGDFMKWVEGNLPERLENMVEH